ncbi:unnamed protein product [Owenia fusiformis]|uniref:Glycine cleavage system H protein n=1 Tax=Owenia fusiformis TaxID=6347 RepID=A0A8J1XR00_OWEFU|nr:unnamed protein product [Owenia fusiformis]
MASTTKKLLEGRVYNKYEWVLMDEGNTATVGISNHGQTQLGEMFHVELPVVGDSVEINDSCGSVESLHAATDVFAPLSGEIVEVNTILKSSPNLINKSPLNHGWLFKMKVKDVTELGKLIAEEQYLATLEDF